MSRQFDRDVAIVGAGRIGLPWATVLAVDHDRSVTCIDIDQDVVANLNDGVPPFEEPQLESALSEAVDEGRLEATTEPSVVSEHQYVVFTINAPRRQLDVFLDAIAEYGQYLTHDHTVIVRSTIPIDIIDRVRQGIEAASAGNPSVVVFPERLAEGKAIEEIRNLPKVVGVDDPTAEAAVRELLDPFDCSLLITTPKEAMLVKLIDNSYRDAMFAISNQIAYTADQLGLDAHSAIELANFEYPRNDIPTPGTVGGKCLPKDPHFLTDETVCEQPTTPDLFNATRRTNATAPNYIATEILRKQPSNVAVLGLAYKRDVSDTLNSPAKQIQEILDARGLTTTGYDPNTKDGVEDIQTALADADVVLLAVNHSAFDDIEAPINEYTPADATVYDIWGTVDPSKLDRTYDGFGMNGD